MPKRKKVDSAELDRLNKKIKRIQNELKMKTRSYRRIRIMSSSSSSSATSRIASPVPDQTQDGPSSHPIDVEMNTTPEDQATFIEEDPCPSNTEMEQVPLLELEGINDPGESTLLTETAENALDSIILDILGEDPTVITEYGKEIHKDLASRLEHFATNGLTKESRKELNDKYLIPSNCARIGAPVLNAEIKAALPESLLKRDRAIEARQKSLAKAISCVSSAITDLLASADKNKGLLKKLMDSERFLCDIQYAESKTRKNFALYALKQDLKVHLSNTKIDKYLFGEDLTETLKNAKAVNKSGIDLNVDDRTLKKHPMQAPFAQPQKNFPGKNLNWRSAALARRQQGPQRSRQLAPPGTNYRDYRRPAPAQSSKPSPRQPAQPWHTRRQ